MSLRETCGSLHHWLEEEEVESNRLPSKGPSPPTLVLSQEHYGLQMLLSGTLLSELEFLRKRKTGQQEVQNNEKGFPVTRGS